MLYHSFTIYQLLKTGFMLYYAMRQNTEIYLFIVGALFGPIPKQAYYLIYSTFKDGIKQSNLNFVGNPKSDKTPILEQVKRTHTTVCVQSLILTSYKRTMQLTSISIKGSFMLKVIHENLKNPRRCLIIHKVTKLKTARLLCSISP